MLLKLHLSPARCDAAELDFPIPLVTEFLSPLASLHLSQILTFSLILAQICFFPLAMTSSPLILRRYSLREMVCLPFL